MSSVSRADARDAPGRLRIDSRPRWFPDLRALRRASHLIVLLGRRDITVKYRQTVLGTVWIFTGPLVSAGLFTFVFEKVAKLASDGKPYFAFSYAGLLGWNLFTSTLSGASTSLNSNSTLISKIYFPRLVLPLASVASTLINTAISFGIMLVVLVVYDVPFSMRMLVLPAWLLLAMVLAMGMGLIFTSVAVRYRDINYVTSVFTSLLLYLSPVAYSTSEVPSSLRPYFQLNPITTIVEGCRWSLLGTNNLSSWAIAYTVALAVGALTIGALVFTRLERGFADVI